MIPVLFPVPEGLPSGTPLRFIQYLDAPEGDVKITVDMRPYVEPFTAISKADARLLWVAPSSPGEGVVNGVRYGSEYGRVWDRAWQGVVPLRDLRLDLTDPAAFSAVLLLVVQAARPTQQAILGAPFLSCVTGPRTQVWWFEVCVDVAGHPQVEKYSADRTYSDGVTRSPADVLKSLAVQYLRPLPGSL